MTISTTTVKSRYAGDGATTIFPTGFKFLDPDHVKVLLRRADGSEETWIAGSEYDVSGAGAPGGGLVAVRTEPVDYTPASGDVLVVKLSVPPRQETSLPLGGAFPSTAVEAMADLAALRDQQVEEALSRAPKFKESTALADVEFPEPVAGKPIGWNADGNALVNLAAIGRWRGDWTTATDYVALDGVRDPVTKNVYVCDLAHSSGDFAADLGASYWSLVIDVEDAEAAVAAAEAAQAAAESAQSAAMGSADAATSAAATAGAAASAASDAQSAAESAAAAAVVARVEWRGSWSAGEYEASEAVEHNGSAWIAATTTTGEPGASDDWDLFAEGGEQGEPGNQGATGTVEFNSAVDLVGQLFQGYGLRNGTTTGLDFTSGVLTLNYEEGPDFEYELTANVTNIVISNQPASPNLGKITLSLQQPTSGGFAVALGDLGDFGDEAAPTMPAGTGATIEIGSWSRDGGLSRRAAVYYQRAGN